MKTIKEIINKKEVINQLNKPLKNKSKKILLYLDHFLIAKRIEKELNGQESYSQAIGRAICYINFFKLKGKVDMFQLSNQEIIKIALPATLSEVSPLINLPRESVRRKAKYLFKKKYIQFQGKHKVYITKKWLHDSKKYLCVLLKSQTLLQKQMNKLS